MGIWQVLSLIRSTTNGPRHKTTIQPTADEEAEFQHPTHQPALILYGCQRRYEHSYEHPVPTIESDRELLVKTEVIGLNPIDWKAPDYGFGIPQLPYVSGRECVGRILTPPRRQSRFKRYDQIMVISTDYRDLRKAAFQQYVVTTDFNAARLPVTISPESGAGIGVAFVAAAILLGVSAGVDFRDVLDGPDLLHIVRTIDPERLPDDIRAECVSGIDVTARARKGDYVAVWGGSSMTALMTIQLAHLAGLKMISILDLKKHVHSQYGTSELRVDSHDPQRAVDIIRAATNDALHFGIDTVGRSTAETLLQCIGPAKVEEGDIEKLQTRSPTSTPNSDSTRVPPVADLPKPYHLIGLTGLPKHTPPRDTKFHSVPIKLFHEIPEIGEALMLWLERLLEQGLLQPPRVVSTNSGLENVNAALDRMRRREISGGRSVIRVE